MDALEFFKNPPVVWFLIGLLFALLELMVPGLVIIFFGVGAWITALLSLIFDMSIGIQILTFVISSVLSLAFLGGWFKNLIFQQKNPKYESDDDEFIGKRAVAKTQINATVPGKITFKGTLWKAESAENIEAGQAVEIIDKESITLIVKPINN
jgi:membrane protein implicated in regulation of membrane protease activity